MALGCLLPNKIKEFRKALKDKKIEIKDLINMESEARIKLLEKYAGTDAPTVNSLFEQKLVLKNKLQGIKNWSSKVGEIGRYDPKRKAELDKMMKEFKDKQMERIFSPKETESFLSSLVEKKIGTTITRQEAKNIFDLTKKVEESKSKFNEETNSWKTEKERLDYGSSKVVLEDYIESLKQGDVSFKGIVRNRWIEAKQMFKENKAKAVFDLFRDTIREISDSSIALVASFDNSFMGRQGLKVLMTHPTAWAHGAKNSFTDIAGTLKGKDMKNVLLADVYSRPNYLNGKYEKAKILPKTEEQYPTTLPERIPGLGRALKASETAFTGSAMRMRTRLFDMLDKSATKEGVNMNDKVQLESIGKLINSLTARGQWGKTGEPAVVRLVLWAPKMLKANIDVLTGHMLGSGLESSFARKQAALNLLKIVATTALILKISDTLKPGSVEWDSRSSDFGKIRIGNTRFDVTGGAASLVTLSSRLITNSTKSTTSGAVTKYGTAFGETTRLDALVDFLMGKTAPAAGIVKDLLKGQTFEGETPTVLTELYRGITPISVQNFIDLKDDNSVQAVLGAIADIFGINANTYNFNTNWNQNPGVVLEQFKEFVGDKKFKEANDEYNEKYNKWITNVFIKYKQILTDEEKIKKITDKKAEIKEQIFKKYNFKYKKNKNK